MVLQASPCLIYICGASDKTQYTNKTETSLVALLSKNQVPYYELLTPVLCKYPCTQVIVKTL